MCADPLVLPGVDEDGIKECAACDYESCAYYYSLARNNGKKIRIHVARDGMGSFIPHKDIIRHI